MPGLTQEALYATLDHELSWSEDELPQYRRTKHVHSLHPYLGKFIPQLVQVFLERYFEPGDYVFDPFVGSGTTLVEANAYGCHSVGCDISAFNCLLCEAKATPYTASLELALKVALHEAREDEARPLQEATDWLRNWYAQQALGELLSYRAAVRRVSNADGRRVGSVILSRAARSARLTTHFDLDFPKKPVRGPYHCHKHKRTCRPVEEAAKFLRRYTLDTIRRLREFSSVRTDRHVVVLHADARFVELPVEANGIITSPPYPGLIDYHEQHRYSYELLRLEDRREQEIGPAVNGQSQSALRKYEEDMVSVFSNGVRQLMPGSPVVIVVNDSKALYPRILDRSGLELEAQLFRHVNRRTGRRAGEFFEEVLVCRAARA